MKSTKNTSRKLPCAQYLEKCVEDLLLHPAQLDVAAQATLLSEVDPVFSPADNQMLLSAPTKEEVEDTLAESNLHAAPGTDGLTSFFYKECFNTMGDPLTEFVSAVFTGDKPSSSQRTSLMVFGSNPKKAKTIKPGDKRRISLLNADFKVISGIESRRFKKTATWTLSPHQLVAGDDRRIHHGINLARDAILASSKLKTGCGIIDTDYMAAFDFLVMSWVFQVLEKKGLSIAIIDRLKNLYTDSISIVVVNNIYGKSVKNQRRAYGIDPLITFLERRLTGILITSIPVLGPSLEMSEPPPPIEERYKAISYADDLKPSIEEIILVDKASAIFEAASGCILHRNPASQKCKILPLGKWRTSLKQENLPPSCNYILISDQLDMVGVGAALNLDPNSKSKWRYCPEEGHQHNQPLESWQIHATYFKTMVNQLLCSL